MYFTCGSLLLWTVLGFPPISTFFSLVSCRAFRDAPHSRFWCRDLKLCLLDFLKMLDLTLSQIYTRVFHFWKSVALENAWVKDSRPFISFFHSRVFSNQFKVLGTWKYCLGFWKSTQSWSKLRCALPGLDDFLVTKWLYFGQTAHNQCSKIFPLSNLLTSKVFSN